MSNYTYPLDYSWSHEEMTVVITLWNALEKVYEQTILADDFLACYQAFKTVVPSKSHERQLSKEFEKVSGYSLYKAHQLALNSRGKKIKMER